MSEQENRSLIGLLKSSSDAYEKVFYTDRRKNFNLKIQIHPSMRESFCEEVAPIHLARKYLFHLTDAACKEGGLNDEQIAHIRKTGTPPPGFKVYFLLPRWLGVSDNMRHCCLMETTAHQRLKEVFYPILDYDIKDELAYQQRHQKKRSIFVALNGVKPIMRCQDVLKMICRMQSKGMLARMPLPKEWIASSCPMDILSVRDGILLVSHRLNSAAIGFRSVVVEVKTRTKAERARIDKEYAQIRPQLVRFFANRCLRNPALAESVFPNLSLDAVRVAAETGRLPRDYKYSAHHIHPRALGGYNDLNNFIWMPHKDHLNLHRMINVYLTYLDAQLEKNPQTRIFAVIPAPLDYKGRSLCFYDRLANRVLAFQEFVEREFKKQQKMPQKHKHNFKGRSLYGVSHMVQVRRLSHRLLAQAVFQYEHA